MSKKTKKKLMIILATVACVLSCVVVYALTTNALYKYKENVFEPAKIDQSVKENGNDNTDPIFRADITMSQSGDDSVYSADKLVEIKNVDKNLTNNTYSLIRVNLVWQWMVKEKVGADKKEVEVLLLTDSTAASYASIGAQLEAGDSFTINGITFFMADKWDSYWFYNEKDGFFYYIYSVDAGADTKPLIAKVEVAADARPGQEDAWLRVDVCADSIQAAGNAAAGAYGRWNNAEINVVEESLHKWKVTKK